VGFIKKVYSLPITITIMSRKYINLLFRKSHHFSIFYRYLIIKKMEISNMRLSILKNYYNLLNFNVIKIIPYELVVKST
jgi:hypothetical protein